MPGLSNIPFHRYDKFSCRILAVMGGKWHLDEKIGSKEKLVIFGYGEVYKYTCTLIANSDYRGSYRCIGKNKKLIDSIKPEEALLLACERYKYPKLANKIRMKNPHIRIVDLDYGICIGTIGRQYLDIFEPKEREIIVDAGACDGTTEMDFVNWGEESIEKIYAFELEPQNADTCIETYRNNNLKNVVLINKGVGDENRTIHLEDGYTNSHSSRIGKGNQEAKICRIDDEINASVTFIKMDIEGEELKALKGAKQTIKKYKPRLAICIYQRARDLYDIPKYISEIVPEYKFAVRHYTSIEWETVLYAWTD